MALSGVRRKIDEEFWTHGRPMTQKFVGSLSQSLLQKCLDRREAEGMTFQAALHRYVYGEPKCLSCGTSDIKFRNFRDGYGKHCSSKCAGADRSVDEKRKQTNLERHGVERPQQELPEIRRKFKRTMREKYGVTYGGESKALRKKAINTSLERYGTKYPSQSSEVQEKIRQTTFERFGVEHVMQDREMFEQQQLSGFKAQEFEIDGKTFKLRGAEHHAVHWLVNQGVKAKYILTTKAEGLPTIWYEDREGQERAYHPDAYVKIKGKWYIVEVKSTFTLGLLRSGGRSGKFSVVKRKAKACVAAGFRFKLLIVAQTRKTYYVAEVKDMETKSRSEVKQELKLLHPGRFRQL